MQQQKTLKLLYIEAKSTHIDLTFCSRRLLKACQQYHDTSWTSPWQLLPLVRPFTYLIIGLTTIIFLLLIPLICFILRQLAVYLISFKPKFCTWSLSAFPLAGWASLFEQAQLQRTGPDAPAPPPSPPAPLPLPTPPPLAHSPSPPASADEYFPTLAPCLERTAPPLIREISYELFRSGLGNLFPI